MAIERRSTYGTFSGQNSLNTLTTAVCSTVFGSVGHTAGDLSDDARHAAASGWKTLWDRAQRRPVAPYFFAVMVQSLSCRVPTLTVLMMPLTLTRCPLFHSTISSSTACSVTTQSTPPMKLPLPKLTR